MMYARISHYEAVDWSPEELRRVGRQLSGALGTAPGFISYALLDAGDRALASVCVFETRAQLEEGERALQAWSSAHPEWPLGSPNATTTGEVIVQRGM
jgi:hypothetical protein